MPVKAIRFSAIVVSFHTGPVLQQCLSALFDAPLCKQVVLVNSGNPSDVSQALIDLSQTQPKLKLVTGQGNTGFGRGCNLGAQHASEDHLVFVNPDCIIDPQALPALADVVSAHPNALVGGLLRNEDGSEQRGARRGELTLWSALVSFASVGRPGIEAGIWRDFNRLNEPMPQQVVEMPVVSGALLAISSPLFKSLGGFDPAFFLHVEDIDLCRRIRDIGGQVMFAPAATAMHVGGTSGVSSWAIERAKIRSFSHYFWKNARLPFDHLAVLAVMPVLAAAVVLRCLSARVR